MNSIKEGFVKYKREGWFTLKKTAWVNSIKEGIVNYNSLKWHSDFHLSSLLLDIYKRVCKMTMI